MMNLPDPVLPTFESDFVFAEEEPFVLASGGRLQPIRLHYAIYGRLNEPRDNAILVCHALSGSARVGDWWPQLFGADGVFDLAQDCIIGINVIGSCYGSTSPRDLDPATNTRYGGRFPLVSISDWVRSQAALLDHLGIARLRAVIGGSVGGMQAMQWAIDLPDRVARCIAVGAAPLNATGLALNHLQRKAIINDPHWQAGDYTDDAPPKAGLAMARALAMCSYKSPELFAKRYARAHNRNGEDPQRSMNERYTIAGYLDYQGEIFTRRFDANSYLIITKAMDNFDPAVGYASEVEALGRITARVLLVGISSDWLFPARDVNALADRMRDAGVRVTYTELLTNHGHDGFLAEPHLLAPSLRTILSVSDNAVSSPFE